MKTTKLLIAFLAIFAISSYAATAAQLKTTIESYRGGGGGGTGSLSVAISGSTLTVTGQLTRVSVSDSSDRLRLDIDAGLSVIWKASLTGAAAYGGVGLIYTTGAGLFEVQSGKIEQTTNCDESGIYAAIASLGRIAISGGEVNSRCLAVNVTGDAATVTISGGTISGRSAAVHSMIGGTVNISGGTVSAGDGDCATVGGGGCAVANAGTLTISGGTVSATTGYAIYNYGGGIATISGGTVSASDDGIAVYNGYNGGTLTISGGTVSATTNYAIYNIEDGIVTISGGLVFAYYDVIDGFGVIYGSGFPSSGNAVILMWDNAAGTTTYTAGTNTDIVKGPAAATAVWDVRGGIAYTNGTNTGFVKVAGVTVNAGTPIIPQIANSNIRIQAIGNAILLENLPTGAKVELYNLQGKLIFSSGKSLKSGESGLKIDVQTKGMYVIKIGTQTTRVAVR